MREPATATDSKCSPVRSWSTRTRQLSWGPHPLLMGIVNVTPDSFSDGGQWSDPQAAIARGLLLLEQGADLVDVGGESTRPYSRRVDESEELRRVIPVIQGLVDTSNAIISIDTSKARVAREAVAAGAEIINDVTGLAGDPQMTAVAIDTGAGLCVMHAQGTPETMQDDPTYTDVVADVYEYLRRRREELMADGVSPDRICLDPGIGFGKTHAHNWKLVRAAKRFLSLPAPILFGHSRKGFITRQVGDGLAQRDAGTLAISLFLAEQGVGVLRLHEVSATRAALMILDALDCPGNRSVPNLPTAH